MNHTCNVTYAYERTNKKDNENKNGTVLLRSPGLGN